MIVTVEMPFIGESVELLRIRAWLKRVGDPVVVDEPLLEVTTEKIDFMVNAPASGVLVEIRAAEDERVAPNTILAIIESAA